MKLPESEPISPKVNRERKCGENMKSGYGVKQDVQALEIWTAGMDEMIKQINPSDIVVYGGQIDYDYGDIAVHYFENKVTENWK